MKPRKPMLDRVRDKRDDELMLPVWQDMYRRLNFQTSSPEEETLRGALNGQYYFDAGTLPEITIRPPKDNAVYKMGYMIPNKSLRNSFYESIEPSEDENIDSRTYINRLWELYNKAQKPTIKNVRDDKFGPVPILEKIKGGDPERAHYNPFTNTLYVSSNPDIMAGDVEAELSHAYQHYGTDMPRKYGWVRTLTTLPGDIKVNGRSGYKRIGNKEFDAHKIIEPLFHDYLTTPNINYEDVYDVMMDMYENPGFYFKSVDKGPFSGSTKRIKPLSK